MTGAQSESFVQLLESFADDFMHLVQSTDREVLRHCSRALLHDIYSVFPPRTITGHSGADPISVKKLNQGNGLWEVRKEILGWMIDGATRCIELTEKRQEAIQLELKTVLQLRQVPFKRIQKLVGKLRHASIGIPAEKYVFGPSNQIMAMEPTFVIWKRCPAARVTFKDWAALIKEAAAEPTHFNKMVSRPADYKGTLDASSKGAGGIWVLGERDMAPIVW